MEFLLKVTNIVTIVASSLYKNPITKWYHCNYSFVLSYNTHTIVSVLEYQHHHQSVIPENPVESSVVCFITRVYPDAIMSAYSILILPILFFLNCLLNLFCFVIM